VNIYTNIAFQNQTQGEKRRQKKNRPEFI